MAIFRVQHNANYTVVNNTICKDKRLSWKAKGIWLYAFSKPNNWQFNLSDLVNQSTDGRDSVYGGLKELEKAGYLVRSQKRDVQGKMSSSEWTFHEIPFKNIPEPHTENPLMEIPISDNPPLVNTDSESSTEEVSIEGNVLDHGKALPFKSKVIEGCKYPLKKSEVKLFEELVDLDLGCEEKTLAILVRTHSSKEMWNAIMHFKYEQDKGTAFKSTKIAFFRWILSGKISLVTEDVIKNKKLAERMKSKLNWSSLSIHDKFVICEKLKKEIPLNFGEEDFFNKLRDMAELSIKY